MQEPIGSVILYHPSGAAVTLPVPVVIKKDDSTAYAYAASFMAVNQAIEAGFLVNAPGLEDGEQKATIGWVARRDHESDGRVVPVILFYSTDPAHRTYKFLHKYLDKEEDIVAFNRVTGINLSTMPVWMGNDNPKHGKSAKEDKCIVKVAKPFTVVFKANPKYIEAPATGEDTRSASQKTARLFLRWGEAVTGQQDTQPQQNPPQNQPKSKLELIAETVAWWKKFFANDPSLAEVNENIKQSLVPMKNAEAKNAVMTQVVIPWRDTVGAEWDKDRQCYVLPKPDDDGGSGWPNHDEYGDSEGVSVPF